ncbi:MAG TPA: 50S ribosomal protein L22 [Dehalococcoidia bacterium]|nr:50S ribosomal protein L22 [Dehalococcoidia bacterium]
MEVSATARYLPVSARKIRLVLDQLPGKSVDEAMVMLRFLTTPNARIVAKVLKSAAANAENNFAMDATELRVKKAYAGEGRTLKRFRPTSRGRVGSNNHKTSHVTVVVEEAEEA